MHLTSSLRELERENQTKEAYNMLELEAKVIILKTIFISQHACLSGIANKIAQRTIEPRKRKSCQSDSPSD